MTDKQNRIQQRLLSDSISPYELDLDEMTFLFHYWVNVVLDES